MKIGELSKHSDCSIQAIRHYEKLGLLPQTQRSEGNFRLYDTQALQRLLFIKHCRHLDISLVEIKDLIQLKVILHGNVMMLIRFLIIIYNG